MTNSHNLSLDEGPPARGLSRMLVAAGAVLWLAVFALLFQRWLQSR